MIHPKDNTVQSLLSSAITVTTNWQDLGEIIDIKDVTSLGLWIDLDINLSQGVQIRFVGLPTVDSPIAYALPILSTANDYVYIQEQVFEVTRNVDTKFVLSVDMLDLVPYGKFQVRAEVAGGAPAQILGADISSHLMGRSA